MQVTRRTYDKAKCVEKKGTLTEVEYDIEKEGTYGQQNANAKGDPGRLRSQGR